MSNWTDKQSTLKYIDGLSDVNKNPPTFWRDT